MEPAAASSRRADYRDHYEILTGMSLRLCPACGDGHMLVIDVIPRAHDRRFACDTS